MDYYPVFMDLRGRRVVLVGGGNVALEKIGRLVEAGADVTVVAPRLIPEMQALVDAGRARLERREYARGDLDGAELVFTATDDGAINALVASDAREAGIWINAADDARHCDFILPSLAVRGPIAIASSTSGSSPALARWLRHQMEQFLSDDVEALADLLADVRTEVRSIHRDCAATCDDAAVPPPLLCADCPKRIAADQWQTAIDDELFALLRRGERELARARLVAALGIADPTPTRG